MCMIPGYQVAAVAVKSDQRLQGVWGVGGGGTWELNWTQLCLPAHQDLVASLTASPFMR